MMGLFQAAANAVSTATPKLRAKDDESDDGMSIRP
jgi:hypothetical protein